MVGKGLRSTQRVRAVSAAFVRRNRRRYELAQKLRDGKTLRPPTIPALVAWVQEWRRCWYYAGFVMRLSHEVVMSKPLTEAEVFELDVLSDIAALPERVAV